MKRMLMRESGFTACLIILSLFLLSACDQKPINNPHNHHSAKANVYHASFAERPRTLDPARSYSSNESLFTAQIYEPPLQYHYLKRPYELITLTAIDVPQAQYYDKNDNPLTASAATQEIAYTIYQIKIKPGIKYQPHPAFARDAQGQLIYHALNAAQAQEIYSLDDFSQQGSRELTAADYVYQIKRLAHPALQSPIMGLMSEYIIGLGAYNKTLQKQYAIEQADEDEDDFIDLREFPLEGAKVIDRYTYEIKIKGKYPQLLYWLAMPFFSPMPWEADQFYSQPTLKDQNISLDWYPVGTGPYFLSKNNPNAQMVLKRNPNFRGEIYPSQGEASDAAKGLFKNAGKRMPFIDEFIFSLEKEGIPRWNKFLQGYYDASGISSDSFDQAINVDEDGQPQLSTEMQQRGITLQTSVGPSIYYQGFNMLDDVVGGYSESAKKLRQAISIAFNFEEYTSIFLNGRGVAAQGPIPPGIFGYSNKKEGINHKIYEWVEGKAYRKNIDKAKKLLAEAGYPNGRNAKTGKPLVLNYDVPASSGPDDKARFDWTRKQFSKLGIQLQIRATQYNRFQEKMRNGNAQIFAWGWLADYPDPENFLFLLYGPNGKVKHGGENAANYHNPQFDSLFEKMKNMHNTPERLRIIKKMMHLLHEDAPWIWGFHPKNFSLSHQWMSPGKPTEIGSNTLKYRSLNGDKRAHLQTLWNKPIVWPIGLFIVLIIIAIIPVGIKFWRKEHKQGL